MIRTRLMLLAACIVILHISGCMTMSSPVKTWHKWTHSSTPKPFEDEPFDEDDDKWNWVGEEARKGLAREEDPDPWFSDISRSDKARAISRSLGVDE